MISRHEFAFPAYDLETILEALPDVICYANEDDPSETNGYDLMICKESISYDYYDSILVEVDKEENGSLADCAAELLIWLHKKGLIKFNEVENDE